MSEFHGRPLPRGTDDIDAFVTLFRNAVCRGGRGFVKWMILREALNQSHQEAAIALIVPQRPTEFVTVTVVSVDQRLREKPESFDHLPAGVEPRHILYAEYPPEVGKGYSIDTARKIRDLRLSRLRTAAQRNSFMSPPANYCVAAASYLNVS